MINYPVSIILFIICIVLSVLFGKIITETKWFKNPTFWEILDYEEFKARYLK